MKTKNDIIQNIKDCGQSLIDNAEKIVGNLPKYTFVNLTLTCHVGDINEPVRINVDYDFSPEKFIERLTSGEDGDEMENGPGDGSGEDGDEMENGPGDEMENGPGDENNDSATDA